MSQIPNRIQMVDALRGFAIVSIMLLHNTQKFHVKYTAENLPQWLDIVEKIIENIMIITLSNKAYGIFALLFGLTYYIQFTNQEKKGYDFRLKFLWRLALLLMFGMFNSMFFKGDIISFYAILALFLIPISKLNNTVLLVIALFLIIHPIELIRFFESILHINHEFLVKFEYFLDHSYLKNEGFQNLIKINITEGKVNTLAWSWENGRILRTLGLFILGMLGGRLAVFESSARNKHFWSKTFFISLLVFIILFYSTKNLHRYIIDQNILEHAVGLAFSWGDLAFTAVLTSGFILLFYNNMFRKFLELFSPVGKMSLTNYISQSIMGASIYYGFGLGLYQYTGMLTTLLIGIILSIAMWFFSVWWLKNHKRGPLEELWHKATWISLHKREPKPILKRVAN